MSSEVQFRPSSPRYGYFSVSAHGTRPGAQTGPFGVQRTPFWGQTGPNMAESGPKRYSTVFCPSTMATGPPTAPHGGTTARFWHFWAIFGPRISLSARVAKIPVNRRFRPGGVRPKKKLFPRKLRKSIPDSVVTFFFGFGTPSAPQSKKGPVGSLGPLACLLARLLVACLLQVQAPPRDPNNWINRLKYYVLQLGDPNPNQDLVLGPS